MPLPHEGYTQQVNPHSTTSTILGMGYETAKWATWRNPWFLSRIGTTGWDPSGKGVMSWLDKRSGGAINKILAPEAGKFYSTLDKTVGREMRAGVGAHSRAARGFVESAQARGLASGAEVGEAAVHSTRNHASILRSKMKARASTAKRLGIGVDDVGDLLASDRGAVRGASRILGERAMTDVEKAAGRATMSKVMTGTAGKYTMAVHGMGKILRGANYAMWFYEATKLGVGAVKAVASIGAQARNVPHSTFGSGIQDNYLAATMRQASLQDMYSSEYGNRRHIGNEARFLHM